MQLQPTAALEFWQKFLGTSAKVGVRTDRLWLAGFRQLGFRVGEASEQPLTPATSYCWTAAFFPLPLFWSCSHFHLTAKHVVLPSTMRNRWPCINSKRRGEKKKEDWPSARAQLSGAQTQWLLIAICASPDRNTMAAFRFEKYAHSSANRCNDSHNRRKNSLCREPKTKQTSRKSNSCFLYGGWKHCWDMWDDKAGR